MSLKPSRNECLDKLQEHVRRSRAVTSELLTEVISKACIRFAAQGSTVKAKVHQMAEHGAWADAVLALLELELPIGSLDAFSMTMGSGTAFSPDDWSFDWTWMTDRRRPTKSSSQPF